MENIDTFVNQQIERTKQALSKILIEIKNDSNYKHIISPFIDPALEIINSGKFIRSKLCIIGALYSNTQNINQETLTNNMTFMTAAIELYHLSALIHDDIIDNSNIRRSKPTAHVQYSKVHKDKKYYGSPENYGKNAAILLGDLLFSKAIYQCQKITLNIAKYKKIIQYFTSLTAEVAIGQYYDLYASHQQINNQIEINKELTREIIITKSAHYSILKPFILGTMLSSENIDLTDISKALKSWGIAFQMKDDEISIFSNVKQSGKNNESDLIDKKKTLLLAYTIDMLDNNLKEKMLEILQNLKDENTQKEEIEYIKKLIVKSGAYAKHHNEIQEYYIHGKEIINQLPISNEVKKYILSLGKTILK